MTLICVTKREADARCPWSVLGPSVLAGQLNDAPAERCGWAGRQVALPAAGCQGAESVASGAWRPSSSCCPWTPVRCAR